MTQRSAVLRLEPDLEEAQAAESGTAPAPPCPDGTLADLAGHSPAIRRVHALVSEAAQSTVGILIEAEEGIDAGAVAREIHAKGDRSGAPFVVVPCHVPERAVAAQLFGTFRRTEHHGEQIERVGVDSALALAAGGTLFLERVTELGTALQVRLARIVRVGEMAIAGSSQPVRFHGRLVASCTYPRVARRRRSVSGRTCCDPWRCCGSTSPRCGSGPRTFRR